MITRHEKENFAAVKKWQDFYESMSNVLSVSRKLAEADMLEIVIQNWDDLQRAVFDDVWDEKIMRYRANRIYRGAADKDWRLVPSLNRVCAHDLGLEQAIIRSFRKYGYTDLAQYTGFWQLLPVAQHYGLPTRLLDWSYSPLVAAHFATEDTDAYDRDGAIWCIDATEVKQPPPQTSTQAFGGSQLQHLLPRPSRRGGARFRRDAGAFPGALRPLF